MYKKALKDAGIGALALVVAGSLYCLVFQVGSLWIYSLTALAYGVGHFTGRVTTPKPKDSTVAVWREDELIFTLTIAPDSNQKITLKTMPPNSNGLG